MVKIKGYINNINYRFLIGRNKEDVEKMVLPAIVYINTNHEAFKEDRMRGFLICIGWWDWSIKLGIILDN